MENVPNEHIIVRIMFFIYSFITFKIATLPVSFISTKYTPGSPFKLNVILLVDE
jgi:hypothetical protein